MEKRPLVVSLALALVVVTAAAVYLGLGARPNLGLDLQGGISAVYTPVLQEGQEPPENYGEVIDETIEVIRARVDSLGVAEPEITRSGTDDPVILVQLPGITDADRVQEIIGRTAQLSFRPVEELLLPGMDGYDEGPDCTGPVEERPSLGDDESGILCGAADPAAAEGEVEGEEPVVAAPVKYRVGPVALSGESIEDASPSIAGGTGFSVALQLDGEGADRFAAVTGELACARDRGEAGMLAIVLDGVVESAPVMNPDVGCGIGLTGGSATITVGATGSPEEQEAEARDLALILRTGSLPITLEPSTFETISPTLGSDALRSGLLAGAIGLVLVGVWLVGFYRWLGLVALGALATFGILVVAVITALGEFGFALTLAGIAGIIVSIGITADSSIIYLERIRDQVGLGRTSRSAAARAFPGAFRTNLAGDTVTLAAAAILYFLAVGPVRGFALTLGISTVLDVLIMYFFVRPAVGLLARTRLVNPETVRAPTAARATAGSRR